ncbi:MAG: hypothetical protein E7544_03905 [Ruminococcaceae bacterium]|nr:hypothetical protein [Oscillospiraceae bacterium]
MKMSSDCRKTVFRNQAIHGFMSVLFNVWNKIDKKAFNDDYAFEAFLAESIIQNLISGKYADLSDVKNNFKYDHFKNVALDYCSRYGIK